MGLDASIYQNIKPVEAPSFADAQAKAATLSQMAMQQTKMQKDMQADDKNAAYTDHLRKAQEYGQTLEVMSGMNPEERATKWPEIRSGLISQGILGEKDLLPEHDENNFMFSLRKYKQSAPQIELGLKKAQTANQYADANKANAEARENTHGGKRLPPDKVLAVSDGARIPKLLEDISGTIRDNSDSFGPVAGRVSAMNPYDEKSQTIDAQVRAASQSFGRFMEGGVLRKEDEDKYRKMFPNLSDTPEVATNKLAIVDRLLKQKQGADVDALRVSGYDTRAFENTGVTPEVPNILKGKKNNEGVAYAAEPPKHGTEENGWVFMGGDAGNPKNWKKK